MRPTKGGKLVSAARKDHVHTLELVTVMKEMHSITTCVENVLKVVKLVQMVFVTHVRATLF